MSDPVKVVEAIKNDPDAENKLKELELQLKDLQNARDAASREIGLMRFMRPMLVLLAFVSLFADFVMLIYIKDEMIRQILILFSGVLILDIRQMVKLYFGSWEDKSLLLPMNWFKKK